MNKKISKKIRHIKKVKWFIPGWVFYEYYKTHKTKGHSKIRSFGHGFKAELIRVGAFASLPVPGTYEITTAGLALIKKKIERGEIEKFTLKSFKDFMPVSRIKGRGIYFAVIKRNKKRYVRIFWKK